MTAGINLDPELSDISINNAAHSQIVKEQLKDPSVDVLTGKTFEEEKTNNSFDGSNLADIFEIDTSAFDQAFDFQMPDMTPDFNLAPEDIMSSLPALISEDDINALFAQIMTNQQLSTDITGGLTQAVKAFLQKQKEQPSLTPEEYFAAGGEGHNFVLGISLAFAKDTSDIYISFIQDLCIKLSKNLISVFSNAVAQSFGNIRNNLLSMQKGFNFDSSKLASMFKLNLTPEKLMGLSKLISGSSTRTYDSNLETFGYADLENPDQIFIYPKDFYSKDEICAEIDSYNEQAKSLGQDDKVISYTDFSKLLINSITTMIDMITAVLVAFVGISLVVSSIMIGIITYISVLERRREIGILRAIGARKHDIFNVFNAETFIIGLIAGVLGIAVTCVLCVPANILAKVIFEVEYDIAILPVWAGCVLILISIFLTFVAGLIPSSAAAKKDPVEAINS